MGDVTYLQMISRHDIPVERILQQAFEEGLESVIVCGYDKEGGEFFASSLADGGTVVWLLERMKLKLLRVPDDGERLPDASA